MPDKNWWQNVDYIIFFFRFCVMTLHLVTEWTSNRISMDVIFDLFLDFRFSFHNLRDVLSSFSCFWMIVQIIFSALVLLDTVFQPFAILVLPHIVLACLFFMAHWLCFRRGFACGAKKKTPLIFRQVMSRFRNNCSLISNALMILLSLSNQLGGTDFADCWNNIEF